MNVTVKHEGPRGCGHRKPGGLYLVTDGLGQPCGRLPLPLVCCPTCGQGIRPARGWSWVDPRPIIQMAPPCVNSPAACGGCPLSRADGLGERAGIIWVGEQFYRTPTEFNVEAARMGVSRRIHQVPKDFKLGQTWVLLAHRKAIRTTCPACHGLGRVLDVNGPVDCEPCKAVGSTWLPGIFHAFQPARIEYVVRDQDTDEALERLVARGITPVRVVPVPAEGPGLFAEGADHA